MTKNITNTTDRQGFAALVEAYYSAHADYSHQFRESSADTTDKAFDAFIEARKALIATPAPDWQGVHDKAAVIAQVAFEGDSIGYGEMKALLDDIAKLRGVASFNPADWLYRWTEYRGGYIVHGGKVNLVTPADHYCPHRCALIGELDIAKGREALNAYILAEQPADQWQALCDALADNVAKLASKGLKEGEVDNLADEQTKAIQALMLYPAPDAAALAYKLEQFAAHDCGEYNDHIRNPMLATLIADARRFAS